MTYRDRLDSARSYDEVVAVLADMAAAASQRKAKNARFGIRVIGSADGSRQLVAKTCTMTRHPDVCLYVRVGHTSPEADGWQRDFHIEDVTEMDGGGVTIFDGDGDAESLGDWHVTRDDAIAAIVRRYVAYV